MEERVRRKERRMIRARREGDRGVWFGLGMFGLVGWSVAIPTVLCILLGVYLDRRFENRIAWTLNCLFIGIVIGCLNAWYWVKRESHLSRKGKHSTDKRRNPSEGERGS